MDGRTAVELLSVTKGGTLTVMTSAGRQLDGRWPAARPVLPPFLVGADDAGLPVEEKRAVRGALAEAAASVEETLARLGLDEALPPPSNNPHGSAGSSSAAAGAPLAPVLKVV